MNINYVLKLTVNLYFNIGLFSHIIETYLLRVNAVDMYPKHINKYAYVICRIMFYLHSRQFIYVFIRKLKTHDEHAV